MLGGWSLGKCCVAHMAHEFLSAMAMIEPHSELIMGSPGDSAQQIDTWACGNVPKDMGFASSSTEAKVPWNL